MSIVPEAVMAPHPAPGPGQPDEAPSPAARATGRGALVLALASAGLLYICYFPVAWGWMAWGALVPFLALVRRPPRGWLYLAAYAGGLAFFWPALQWMRVADPRMYVTWMSLATICAIYWPVALLLLRALDRRTSLPLVVTLPIVWVALEYFRASFIGLFASMLLGSHQHDWPGGFSWYMLGHSQHAFVEVIQIADLGGVYAVSFLVALVNAVLFEVLARRQWFRAAFLGGPKQEARGRRAPASRASLAVLVQGVCVAAALLATLAYGQYRLAEHRQREGPRLALLQANHDQRIRNSGAFEARISVRESYDILTRAAAERAPDLIVWPESSHPVGWREDAPGVPDPVSKRVAREVAADSRGAAVLLGVEYAEMVQADVYRRYNSAVLIDRHGQYVTRYDKVHRVPFGEYVPVPDLLPFMSTLAPYDGPYSVQPGQQFTCFPFRARSDGHDYTFGVVICYEDTVAEMALPYGGGGSATTDFVLNISNDGWFQGTAEHDEHLAICRFRAVEMRRSVARAVNMGISAIIDSNGRVLAPKKIGEHRGAAVWAIEEDTYLPVGRWHEFKKVEGVMLGTVPIDDRHSLYAAWGNWLPVSCWGLLGLALILPRRKD